MKKRMTLLLAILLFCSFTFSIVVPAEEPPSMGEVSQSYDAVMMLIQMEGITDKNEIQLLKAALLKLAMEDQESLYHVLNSLAGSVDENSAYYTPEEWKTFQSDLSGVTGGIGVLVTVSGEYLEVMSSFEGGPAQKAGLDTGDRIIEADGVDLTGKAALYATNYLRGEIGTTVTIKVLKKNGSIETHTLVRSEITMPSVSTAVIDDKVAYLRISSFTQKTTIEAKDALKEFKNKGLNQLVLDLRNNGGGLLSSGLEVASLFMKKDETIISIRGKDPVKDVETYKTIEDGFDFDLVILVNENTASASEVALGAITENEHGISVGATTYGKATVQKLYPLGIGGALRLTVNQYFTPKGNAINKKGITPDHEVENVRFFYSASELPTFSYQSKLDVGYRGEDAKTAKILLKKLGYFSGEEEDSYDEKTKVGVSRFQEDVGLFPYGVLDLTTQSYLFNKVLETEFVRDSQLDFAVDLLLKKE